MNVTEEEIGLSAATRLRMLQREIDRQGNHEIAQRIGDLAERLDADNGQVFVAFCGLFSAGKSSLLNTLCNQEMFSTGAVPTTAQIQQAILPGTDDKVVLIDTPGIDSTDDSHQAETLGAMHRADLVALVMDYQHVEADSNLELARSFSEQGKQMFLVVNQIDKHMEWEIPFVEYRRRIEQTFADWGIEYEQIFYTSSEQSDWNELSSLYAALTDLRHEASDLAQTSVMQRLRELIEQFVDQKLEHDSAGLQEQMASTFGHVPFDEEEAVRMRENSRHARDEAESTFERHMAEAIAEQQAQRELFVRSVELAQIAPYETTERGRQYVESLHADFRVGWLGWRQKTAREQEARLTAFAADLAERTEKYLIWPLQNSLRQFVQDKDWADSAWMNDVAAVTIEVTPELCRSIVKPGALVSNQYPYQYVKDVVHVVKRNVYSRLTTILDGWFAQAQEKRRQQLETVVSEKQKYASEVGLLNRWLEFQRDRLKQIEELVQQCQR